MNNFRIKIPRQKHTKKEEKKKLNGEQTSALW